jgi:hypothetical protein
MLGLGGALSWIKEIQKSYEYWKEYKGERVVIRQVETSITGENEDLIRDKVIELEGEISDVKALPPGFMLTDVERRVSIKNNSLIFAVGKDEPEAIPGASGDMTVREIDRKFVSFNSINELEFLEDNREAFNPLKEDQ